MKLLALDPASRVTGFAVITGLRSVDLADAGVLRASQAKAALDAVEHLNDAERRWITAHNSAALRRTYSMLPDLAALLAQHDPDVIVIETPSGKVGTGARNGASSSLTSYALAVGLILGRLDPRRRVILPVSERVWLGPGTGIPRSKVKRQACAAVLYAGQYRIEDDAKSGDIADAIMLARWGWQRWDALRDTGAPTKKEKARS